ERTAERFLHSDLDVLSVILDESVVACTPVARWASDKVKVEVTGDVWVAAAQKLCEFAEIGIDHAFICDGREYVECDLIDFLQFHRRGRHAVTRASDRDGVLNFWVADCARVKETNLAFLFEREPGRGFGPGY